MPLVEPAGIVYCLAFMDTHRQLSRNHEPDRGRRSWDNNKSMTVQALDLLYADMLAHAKGKELYAQDFYGVAFSAPADGASLRISAMTASKLAWAA